MDALRNVSNQSFILPKQGGGSMHLLPGRAITLSTEEQKSPQVKRLLQGGFAQIEKLGGRQAKSAAKEEKRPEKKKVER